MNLIIHSFIQCWKSHQVEQNELSGGTMTKTLRMNTLRLFKNNSLASIQIAGIEMNELMSSERTMNEPIYCNCAV